MPLAKFHVVGIHAHFYFEKPLVTILFYFLSESSENIYKIIQFCCCKDEDAIDLSPQPTYLLPSSVTNYECINEEQDIIFLLPREK